MKTLVFKKHIIETKRDGGNYELSPSRIETNNNDVKVVPMGNIVLTKFELENFINNLKELLNG